MSGHRAKRVSCVIGVWTAILTVPASVRSSPQQATAQALVIDHQPPGCVVAEKHPRLEARFTPADLVAAARVLFQGTDNAWYSVAMKAEGRGFVGVLPKPKKNLREFRYYIEVTGQSMETGRTPEYAASVVEGAAECKAKLVAPALGSASVLVQAPAGAPALPAGFASAGVVGAGGGISATTLGIVGGAVAGGVAVATQVSGGSGGSGDAYTGSFSYNLVFSFPEPSGTCTRTEQNSGTLEIDLNDSGGVASIENAKAVVVTTACGGGPQPGQTTTWGMPDKPVTRSGSSLSFEGSLTETSKDPTGGPITSTWKFSGISSGDTITGTLSNQIQWDAPRLGLVTSNIGSSAVTLTRRR